MNVLDEIFAAKRLELLETSRAVPLEELVAQSRDLPPARGFQRAIESATAPALIAEVKKASPVKGLIREDFDPVEIAKAYEKAGATCLSVLTDHRFQGESAHLIAVRKAVSLPILRKDFTASRYHLYEARVMGADAILLIAYGLGDDELRHLSGEAREIGLDVLFEAHTEEEAERCLSVGAKLLGINNRDLTSFETSVSVGLGLLPSLRGRATLVSESALKTADDVRAVHAAGAQAVLIGTAFCASPDPGAKVREVMGW